MIEVKECKMHLMQQKMHKGENYLICSHCGYKFPVVSAGKAGTNFYPRKQ